MKTLKFLLFILFLLILAMPIKSQDNSVVPQRTPEQEATKQTEKLQQELNLTPEQTKQVYEINLHYARERQISNTRSEAIERMKNKNADIQRVLNAEQNERLQTKRYERTTIDAPNANRNQSNMSSGFRAPTEFRSNQTVRVPSGDMNVRNSYRQSTPPATQQGPQSVRRSTPTYNSQPAAVPQAVRSAQPQGNPSATRSAPGTSTSSPRRSEPATSSGRR
jgi:Na+-transporting methylmalonyl-CoA/oxaloacetate decarboxylase gamma subunit